METTICNPETLMEAIRYFADLDVCHRYMVSIRWPDGAAKCPKCGGSNVGEIATRRMFQCKDRGCRKQFSTKVGTIFEDSPLGLDKWFVAVWSIANCKNGISSHELARALGITQKSAWFMLHRVRAAMKTKSFRKITGVIESDETFIGGKAKNMHKSRKAKRMGRGWIGKQIVHGLLERGKDVRVKIVPNTKRPTMLSSVREHVEPGASVYTDALASYVGLEVDFVHRMIDHAKEYVRGAVHTNGLENFWSLLKRSIRGSYVWVSPEHLQAYLDEQAFRFNCRKSTDGERFRRVLRTVVGRRLSLAELTSREAVA
jgi:transposase-like protein